MLYATTIEEVAATDSADIKILSKVSRFFKLEMREAACRCFVHVGLPSGFYGNLATAEDCLKAPFDFTKFGGDYFYCADFLDIQKVLCENHVPIVAHARLVPSYITCATEH